MTKQSYTTFIHAEIIEDGIHCTTVDCSLNREQDIC